MYCYFYLLTTIILVNKSFSTEQVKNVLLNDTNNNLYINVHIYNNVKPGQQNSVYVCNEPTNFTVNYTAGYTYIPDLGYYKYYADVLSWHMAAKICEQDNAHLVIINSQQEHDYLVKLITDKLVTATTKVNYVHVGFHDQYVEGQYVTIHDEPLCISGFYKWRQNQPDNARNNENCGSMHKEGLLNDIGCFYTTHFICEI